MSVRALRARIAKLETQIALQSEVLKKLERDKSHVQRQLNAVVDPVARLPLELSSEIFLRSLPPFPWPETPARIPPILLLNISHAWRTIALSTPSLWAAIRIVFPQCGSGLNEALPIWLERAQSRPLFISLEGFRWSDGNVVAIIWRHRTQLKHLDIREVWADDRDESTGQAMANWMSGPLPSLETLTIRGPRGGGGHGFPLRPIFQLLRQAPNLTECFFHFSGSRPYTTEILALPSVRRLMFGEPRTRPLGSDSALAHLSLPRLEALSISMVYVNVDVLVSFLKRSSPPLLELGLGQGLPFVQLAECLQLVPTLERLELWESQWPPAEQLCSALATSSSLLPCLHTLVIHLNATWGGKTDSFWTAPARALAARRTQFRVLRLTVPYSLSMPPPETIAFFKELAVDGTQVCIEVEHT